MSFLHVYQNYLIIPGFIALLIYNNDILAVSALKLSITNNGPAVLGSNVTFRAIVSDYNEETLKYSFFDDLRHSESVSTDLLSYKY